MEINAGNLGRLFTGYKTAFDQGKKMVTPMHEQVAEVIPSTTEKEEYDWLGEFPGMREWLGDRHIQGVTNYQYQIRNKDWEQTIGVSRNKIQDDTYGLYASRFRNMGRAVQAHPSQLVYALLKAGFASLCYDGQYFFDTDHPVLDENGAPTSVANTDGGAGTPWFLIDSKMGLKPIIFQERQKPNFVSKDNQNDDNVFMRKQFLYGTDARYNVGYGFWQCAWGSRQTLNAANYATARAAVGSVKGDYGRPIGLTGDLLIVPPSLESAGRKIINNELGANGETNEWKGTAELLVVPWLA